MDLMDRMMKKKLYLSIKYASSIKVI